jgi:electron transfer flavoprotein beta subunit
MIAVCIKSVDGRLSAADEAAIETAMLHSEATQQSVTVVTVGSPVADHGLRVALASGAAHAVRVDAPDDLDSVDVAQALVPVVTHSTAIWCGDYSADRGSGSVPAFLAHSLQRQQALGLIGVKFGDPLRVVRRLDGGRREHLLLTGPAVLSVEGSVARLRRAALRAALAAQSSEVLPLAGLAPAGVGLQTIRRAYRPRARALAAPVGTAPLDRLRTLTDTAAAARQGRTIEAEPRLAAQHILAALAAWGYLD